MIFDKKNEAISEQEVQRFELTRGIGLPFDYRNFLLEFNGGRPADMSDVSAHRTNLGV